ncbi:hypothetical protein NDU88_007163 [Pleurodeles waltl]|uniref:Uncharacterized protein n=1 Tax=Pleurodeles waltl TaxID=8319 RepID=A0AAV7MIB8_PLEWA|nr:hypothetical protein NDU88_007163 [Pleurodeles waltl]
MARRCTSSILSQPPRIVPLRPETPLLSCGSLSGPSGVFGVQHRLPHQRPSLLPTWKWNPPTPPFIGRVCLGICLHSDTVPPRKVGFLKSGKLALIEDVSASILEKDRKSFRNKDIWSGNAWRKAPVAGRSLPIRGISGWRSLTIQASQSERFYTTEGITTQRIQDCAVPYHNKASDKALPHHARQLWLRATLPHKAPETGAALPHKAPGRLTTQGT